jgi:hypothetical protein
MTTLFAGILPHGFDGDDKHELITRRTTADQALMSAIVAVVKA